MPGPSPAGHRSQGKSASSRMEGVRRAHTYAVAGMFTCGLRQTTFREGERRTVVMDARARRTLNPRERRPTGQRLNRADTCMIVKSLSGALSRGHFN